MGINLSDDDHETLDHFLNHVLVLHKSGVTSTSSAIATLAHAFTQAALGDPGVVTYMKAVLESDDLD